MRRESKLEICIRENNFPELERIFQQRSCDDLPELPNLETGEYRFGNFTYQLPIFVAPLPSVIFKARINARVSNGDTLLHLCVRLKNIIAALKLLSEGADTTISNNDGFTPFELALNLSFSEMVTVFRPHRSQSFILASIESMVAKSNSSTFECRLEPGYAEHFRQSQRAIIDAASKPERKKTALILGAGNCIEIPLANIARTYERVVLVDIDSNAVERSIDRLPEYLQKKCQLHHADITGLLGNFKLELYRIKYGAMDAMQQASKINSLLGEYAKAIETSIRDQIQTFGAYNADFVVSSLLITQLASLFEDVIMKMFPGIRLPQEYLFRISDLSIEMQKFHVQLLEKITMPGGVTYLACTSYRRSKRSFEAGHMIASDVLSDYFTSGHACSKWDWEVTDYVYTVSSYTAKKPLPALDEQQDARMLRCQA